MNERADDPGKSPEGDDPGKSPEGDGDPLKAMSARKKRFLVAGAVVGAAMVIVPFVTAAASIAGASRVPEGLRGATHIPAMKDRVGFALGSASLTALLAPPGILLFVLSSLPLAEQKRRRDRR